jgi:hypothetical protein
MAAKLLHGPITPDHVLRNNRRSGAITRLLGRASITDGHARSRSLHHRRSRDHATVHADHAASVHETHHPYKGWVSDAARTSGAR